MSEASHERCIRCDPLPGDCINCEVQIESKYKTSWFEMRNMLDRMAKRGNEHAAVVLQFMDKILERNS